METLGSYRVVRELSRKPYGTIYIARKEGSEEDYLIKVFNPLGSSEEEVADDAPVLSFLESATLQMKITHAHAGNWAPVVDMGICPEGGYYVSRYYSSSAKRLVDGHFHFQSNTLKAVAQGIVNGLKEIKAIAGRPHGDLYLTSILIDRNRINRPDGTVLAEPAPTDVAKQAGILGDLSNLGKVLYQLITNKPHAQTSTLWPIQISNHWDDLRSAKEAWLSLVNWLLDPDAKELTHTLEALEEKLGQIRHKRSKAPLLIIGTAALLATVGAGALGIWYISLRGQWRQFTKLTREPSLAQAANFYAYYVSMEDFRAGLARPELANLPEIQALRDALEKLRAKNAAFDLKAFEADSRVTADSAPLEILRSKRWKNAQADLEALERAINGWKVSRELTEAANKLADWSELKDLVERIAGEAGIKQSHPKPEAMIRAIEWKNAMGDFDWSAKMENIRSAKQMFVKLEDPLLDQFAVIADSLRSAGAKVKTPAELTGFKDRLSESDDLASFLKEAVKIPEIRPRLLLADLKSTEFYQSSIAKIRASADPIVARMDVLKAWPQKVLAVQLEVQPDVSPLRRRLTLAKKEAELAREFAIDDDLAIMNRRIESASQSMDKMESPNLSPDERATLSQQIELSLNSLNELIQENQKAGEARQTLLQSLAGEFARSISSIEKQIAWVREFDPDKARGLADQLEAIRKKSEAFQVDYRRRRESDIKSDSAELLKSIKELLATASGIQPPEPPVDILRFSASSAEPLRTAIMQKWDDWKISVVGQTTNKVHKSVNAKLEPLVAEFKKLDAAAMKITLSPLSAKGEVSAVAAKKLSAMATDHAVELIQAVINEPGAAQAVNSAALETLASSQAKWTADAGKWLKAWEEIESALNAGKGSAEKHQTDTPANLRKTADEIAKAENFTAEMIKPLSDRMDRLAEVEALAASVESADALFSAIAAGKPELAMAGSRTLSMLAMPAGSLEKIGAAREADSKLRESLRPALAERLDQCAVASLKAIYSSKADFDSIASASAIRELKKKAGLKPSTTADDLASIRKELEAVGLWGMPEMRANLGIKLAKAITVTDNKSAVEAVKVMIDVAPDDYSTSISDTEFKKLLGRLKDLKINVEKPVEAEGGPDSKVFERVGSDDAEVMLFTANFENKTRQLAFRLINGVEGRPVYLCVTETPLWVVAMLVKSKSLNMNDLGAADEADESPRAWYNNSGLIDIRKGWLPEFTEAGKPFYPYPQPLMVDNKPGKLNELQSPGANPSWDQPAHFISPAGAIKAAAAMKCRLPKITEWRLAAQEQQEAPNLRDKSWNDFTVYLRNVKEDRRQTIMPAIPTAEELGVPAGEKAGQGAPWNKTQLTDAITKAGFAKTPLFVANVADGMFTDNYVFLRPATAKEKFPFADLLGNVWELVSDDNAPAGLPTIVGGSALSSINAGLGELKPWNWDLAGVGTSKGYEDLGFRLAFEGKEKGPKPQVWEEVRNLLKDAKYIGK
jgi:hypothetical protein